MLPHQRKIGQATRDGRCSERSAYPWTGRAPPGWRTSGMTPGVPKIPLRPVGDRNAHIGFASRILCPLHFQADETLGQGGTR